MTKLAFKCLFCLLRYCILIWNIDKKNAFKFKVVEALWGRERAVPATTGPLVTAPIMGPISPAVPADSAAAPQESRNGELSHDKVLNSIWKFFLDMAKLFLILMGSEMINSGSESSRSHH
jgi:hypothetical protein